jgi:sugar transferase (PEP-CTERM/EpsH1 system associated)
MDVIHDPRPLIVHVIHHLVIGGMENGLVNLVNLLPSNRYRHAIVCIEDYSDFRKRIRDPDIAVYAMRRSGLRQWQLHWKLFRLFRKLRPAIVHSRNRSGLDSLIPALMAGVRLRLHGEHGWDVDDIDGENRRLRNLRRVHRPFVSRYVCVSKHLRQYLIDRVGVAPDDITQIYNGVDIERFKPRTDAERRSIVTKWAGVPRFIVGMVGRLQPVKNQGSLLRAVSMLVQRHPQLRNQIGVAIVGDGPERVRLERDVQEQGLQDMVEFLGARDDVADLLRHFDVFVLPSLAEGISNTILEAMACGVPVIATAVGGNVELVADGTTGRLVASNDDHALMAAIREMVDNRTFAVACGIAGRARAQTVFSLPGMVEAYDALYASMLRTLRKPIPGMAY